MLAFYQIELYVYCTLYMDIYILLNICLIIKWQPSNQMLSYFHYNLYQYDHISHLYYKFVFWH